MSVSRLFCLLVISVCIFHRLVRMISSHNDFAKLNFFNYSLWWTISYETLLNEIMPTPMKGLTSIIRSFPFLV